MAYIDTKYLFECETCRRNRTGMCDTWCESGECYQPDMSKIPTADVVEVKHGEWELHRDGSGTCSVCGRHQKHIWDMCSWQKYYGHCGAKMDGERRDT